MEIKIESVGIDRAKAMLDSMAMNTLPAEARALNRTATGVRTDMTRIVTRELNVRASDVRDRITIRRASASDLTSFVKRTGKRLGLRSFIGTREVAAGISVKVKKTGERALLKHAFIAHMNSGHIGVFWRQWSGQRTGPKTSSGKKKRDLPWKKFAPGKIGKGVGGNFRLKISELSGPAVESILSADANFRELELKAAARLEKELLHEVDREIAKRG